MNKLVHQTAFLLPQGFIVPISLEVVLDGAIFTIILFFFNNTHNITMIMVITMKFNKLKINY